MEGLLNQSYKTQNLRIIVGNGSFVMLSWCKRCTRRSRLSSTFNTQVEARKQNVCWGRLSISMESTPPLRLTFVASLPPLLTSPFVCAQTCREFSAPVAKRTWTEPAQWAQWVLRMRRIPAASAASDLCGTIMSAGGGVSILRPYANSFQIRTKQNKTKAGTVGYGLLRSFLLAFCLFMRTFCAGRTFHILCELPARCFVYLHYTLTHTHTHRTPPASSSSPLINAACLGIKG